VSSGCVLVTGGAGFIGSNFLNAAVPSAPERAFVNVDKLTYAANLSNLRALQGAANYRLERADIAERAQLEAVFERYRPVLVVHFAAETHVDRSILEPDAFIRTNVVGTFNLLEAFKRWSASQPGALFHHVSTDEVYGSLGDSGRFSESSPYDPSSPYSASKAASDHLVRSYARTYGLPVKITNCSNNYGPYQFPEKLIPLMIINALARKALPVYGRGSNVRDWLHVADHCAAIWAVIEHGEVGATYNIGGGDELRNLEVVQLVCDLVAEQTGQRPEALRELITFVQDRPGHDLRYAIDAARIGRECGWTPARNFTTGLRETVAWYLGNAAWVEEVRSGEYQRWLDANYAARPNAG
jgi:dTDP-glucose 4,6-dehydratase